MRIIIINLNFVNKNDSHFCNKFAQMKHCAEQSTPVATRWEAAGFVQSQFTHENNLR
jgi:hypothetical protein